MTSIWDIERSLGRSWAMEYPPFLNRKYIHFQSFRGLHFPAIAMLDDPVSCTFLGVVIGLVFVQVCRCQKLVEFFSRIGRGFKHFLYLFTPPQKMARWSFQIIFLFSPLFGEMIQFDEHIFQMGWFNHQLDG